MPQRNPVAADAASRHDAAIAAFYAAATGQGGWSDALDCMLLALHYDTATFYVHDRRSLPFDPLRPAVQRGLWHRLDPAGEVEYRDHYFRLDPRVAYTLAHPGTPLLFDQLYSSPEQMQDSPYRSWYRRATGMEHSMGGHAGVEQPFFGSIALHRRRRLGPSTRTEHKQFSRLFRHLEQALAVEYRLQENNQGLAAFHALAENNPNGVLFIDRLGRVLHANARARAQADRGDAFVLGRTMASRRHSDQAALQHALGQAVAGFPATPVRLSRAGGRGCIVSATPVGHAAMSGLFELSAVAACIIITDEAARPGWSEAVLQAAFGLTGAEARLLSRMAVGHAMPQIAEAIGVTIHTLRTQLAAIFRKTGTNRQADLVRLVHSLPPQVG